MSSIIDNTIFQSLVIFTDRQPPLKDHTLVQQIFHKLKVNQKYHITTNNDKIYQTKSTFEMPDKTFLVNLHLKRSTFNSKFTAIKIDQLTNQKVHSKHIDLLIMKEFFKYQKQFPSGSYVYINNGRIYLVMTNFLPNNQALKRSRIIDIYNEFLIKNLLNFQIFLKKYIQNKGNKTQREKQIVSQLNKQLQLARIVNTTHSTSNISIDKSHFRSANTSFEKRTDELMSIREMIEQQVCFQKTAQKLYDIVQEETYATWIKQNYIKYYMQNQKKIHNILALQVSAERKLEDFVYNMVKLEVKERIGGNVPINAGASSYIFAIQANITYISSTDMTVLPQSILKDEKILAVKKLKNQDPKKFDKIQHQKAVILKMRGSICPFLPKYFGNQSQIQLQKCLIMQLIQGENLDDYVTSRVQTMTLWTKISLLLNIIYGMRHLINYQITHLDLKPLNIKVVKNMITKIFDFGQAYHPEICSKEYIAASTFPYAAPEVFTRFCLADRKKNYDWQYSQKQDSYAFGVIMYEIIFGDCIYSLSTNKLKEFCLKKQTIRKIFLAPQRGQDYGEDKILSSILYIVLRCLDLDPSKRPCFEWIGISLKLMLNSYINIS